MFAIAVENKQYQTYILSDQTANSQVEVVPERGGIVTSWKVAGKEIFYLDTERFTHPDLSVRGGIPILFPICGNLIDNIYSHNGQTYNLKQHGFARDLPWQVSHQSTTNGASITVVLTSNDQTRVGYPFDFEVAFTYQLQGNTLKISQKYSNKSQEKMPFSTGLHPYFAAPDKSQLEIKIPSLEYWDQKNLVTETFEGKFDFNLEEIDAAFKDLTGSEATVADRSRKLKLTMSWDKSYSTFVFWTVKGKDFYCIEPWTAGRNALNTKERLIYLEPGADLETVVQLTVSEI